MSTIKIYIIPWLLFNFFCVHYAAGGLCQQQAESAFQFLSLGHGKSKQACYHLCCQKKDCDISLTTGKTCYGIRCAHKDLCKLITDQLSNFQGHRVDKRSLFLHDNTSSNFLKEIVALQEHQKYKRSSDEDEDEGENDKSDSGNENDEVANNKDRDVANEHDGDSDTEVKNEKTDTSSTCSAAKFHGSIIPKREKSFKFRKLHHGSSTLEDCSKRCCKTGDCVLAFILEKKCYGVMCSGEKSCHSKKDHLPHTKAYIAMANHEHKKVKKHKKRKKHKYMEDNNTKKSEIFHSEQNSDDTYKNFHESTDESFGENEEGERQDHDTEHAQSYNEPEVGHTYELPKHGHIYHNESDDELHDDIQMLNYMKNGEVHGQIDDDRMGNLHSQEESIAGTLPDSIRNRGENAGYRYSNFDSPSSKHHKPHSKSRDDFKDERSGENIIPTEDQREQEQSNLQIYNENSNHAEDGKYGEFGLENHYVPHVLQRTYSTEKSSHSTRKHSKKENVIKTQSENEGKSTENLILQKIENLEHKLESKHGHLTPTEKNTEKALKTLHVLEEKVHSIVDKNENNSSTLKHDSALQHESTEGSGSAMEDNDKQSESLLKQTKVKTKSHQKRNATRNVSEKNLSEKKSKLKYKKVDYHTRDHIEKPKDHESKKHEETARYGHKEDIFKEFEKFREMYEKGSGMEDHSHKQEEFEKETPLMESSGEGSGEGHKIRPVPVSAKEKSGKKKSKSHPKSSKHFKKVTSTTPPPVDTTTTTVATTTPTTKTTTATTTVVPTTTTTTKRKTTERTTHKTTQAAKKSFQKPTVKLVTVSKHAKTHHHTKPLPTEAITHKSHHTTTKSHRPKPTKEPRTTHSHKVIPTVAVDGLENKNTTKIKVETSKQNNNNDHIKFKPTKGQIKHQEQDIKGLTSHLTKSIAKTDQPKLHKGIPSLNIAVGDEDTENNQMKKNPKLKQDAQNKVGVNKSNKMKTERLFAINKANVKGVVHRPTVPPHSTVKPSRKVNHPTPVKVTTNIRRPTKHVSKPTNHINNIHRLKSKVKNVPMRNNNIQKINKPTPKTGNIRQKPTQKVQNVRNPSKGMKKLNGKINQIVKKPIVKPKPKMKLPTIKPKQKVKLPTVKPTQKMKLPIIKQKQKEKLPTIKPKLIVKAPTIKPQTHVKKPTQRIMVTFKPHPSITQKPHTSIPNRKLTKYPLLPPTEPFVQDIQNPLKEFNTPQQLMQPTTAGHMDNLVTVDYGNNFPNGLLQPTVRATYPESQPFTNVNILRHEQNNLFHIMPNVIQQGEGEVNTTPSPTVMQNDMADVMHLNDQTMTLNPSNLGNINPVHSIQQMPDIETGRTDNMPEDIGELKFDNSSADRANLNPVATFHLTTPVHPQLQHSNDIFKLPVHTEPPPKLRFPTVKILPVTQKMKNKVSVFHNLDVLKQKPTENIMNHQELKERKKVLGLKDKEMLFHNLPVQHVTAKPVVPQQKQESPLEVVHRILGHRNNSKKPSALDDFFKTGDEKKPPQKPMIMKNNSKSVGNQHNIKHKQKLEKLKKLDNFFKKAEIDHAGNISHHENLLHLGNFSHVNSGHKLNETSQRHSSIGHAEKLKPVKGCNIVRDIQQKMFANEKMVYVYHVPGKENIASCEQKCCLHEDCDVAFLEDQVCKLVQCKNQTACHNLKPTARNIRLLFFDKKKQNIQSNGYCENQHAIGVPWERTKAGTAAVRSCPRDASGEAKRLCDEHSHWLSPDFTNCISQDYSNLHRKVKGLGYTTNARAVAEELDDVTTQTIDNSLIFGGDLIKATEIIAGISNFLTKNKFEKIEHKDLRSITRSVSNLFDETNKQEWTNLKNFMGPPKLMKSLDNVGLYAADKLPRPMMMRPVVTRSILVSVAKVSPNTQQTKHSFPNYSVPLFNEWSSRKDSIVLPPNLFSKDKPTLVASMNFKTLGYLLPHRWNTKKHVTFTDGFVINSNVISCSIHPKPIVDIKPPVTVVLHHLKEIRAAETKCVFWDFNSGTGGGGTWSTEGCVLVSSNKSTTVCECNHLTHFAVLSNTNEQKVSAKEQVKEHTMAVVWLGIPITIVLLVGALYTCFAWSKAPRRSHVVIMDKKPVLPDNEIVVTQTVSEKYPGSPDRYLYAANCTPSPSELEWEHAWDFLTNSDFDMINKKQLQSQLKKELVKQEMILERKRLQNASDSSTSTLDSQGTYFQWKHQDDAEWSKERIKCLGKGLFDVSNEHAQPSSDNNSYYSNDDAESLSSATSHIDTFFPVAMSSPHSVSLEEMMFSKSESLRNGTNYLQISFDPEVDGQVTSDSSSHRESPTQSMPDISDIDTAYSLASMDILQDLEENVLDKHVVNELTWMCDIYDDAQKTSVYDLVQIDITSSYLSYEQNNSQLLVSLKETVIELFDSHIFSCTAFSRDEYTLHCDHDCCDTGITLLFQEEENSNISGTISESSSDEDTQSVSSLESDETDVWSTEVYSSEISSPSTPIKSRKINAPAVVKSPDRSPSFKMKKSPTVTHARIAKHIPKNLFKRTTVSASGCRVKMIQKESKQTPTHAANMRAQTPHMKSYIALRQQCRMNDSQLTRGVPSTLKRQSALKSARRLPHKRNSIHIRDIVFRPKQIIQGEIPGSSAKLRDGCLKKKKLNDLSHRTLNAEVRQKLCSKSLCFKSKPRVMKKVQTQKLIKTTSSDLTGRRKGGISRVVKPVIRKRKYLHADKKSFLEKRTFSGHLKRWHCEELSMLD